MFRSRDPGFRPPILFGPFKTALISLPPPPFRRRCCGVFFFDLKICCRYCVVLLKAAVVVNITPILPRPLLPRPRPRPPQLPPSPRTFLSSPRPYHSLIQSSSTILMPPPMLVFTAVIFEFSLCPIFSLYRHCFQHILRLVYLVSSSFIILIHRPRAPLSFFLSLWLFFPSPMWNC